VQYICRCKPDGGKDQTHQLLIDSLLAMWNIAQQQTTHKAEILGAELVAIV